MCHTEKATPAAASVAFWIVNARRLGQQKNYTKSIAYSLPSSSLTRNKSTPNPVAHAKYRTSSVYTHFFILSGDEAAELIVGAPLATPVSFIIRIDMCSTFSLSCAFSAVRLSMR